MTASEYKSEYCTASFSHLKIKRCLALTVKHDVVPDAAGHNASLRDYLAVSSGWLTQVRAGQPHKVDGDKLYGGKLPSLM